MQCGAFHVLRERKVFEGWIYYPYQKATRKQILTILPLMAPQHKALGSGMKTVGMWFLSAAQTHNVMRSTAYTVCNRLISKPVIVSYKVCTDKY